LYLDLDAGVMRYGAGGHPPMLWRRASGAVEFVEENGLILGLIASAPYASVERPVATGDRFLLYTDGLAEAANTADEFFGQERIREQLASSGALSPEACAESLLNAQARWSASRDDDLTVVLVDVLAHK